MQMHPKKRVEIIVEAPLLRQVIARLDAAHVTGYCVLPVLAGRGQEGFWSAEGQIGEAGRMLMVICIVDTALADEVLEAVFAVVSRQIGLVTMSEVTVVRPGRF